MPQTLFLGAFVAALLSPNMAQSQSADNSGRRLDPAETEKLLTFIAVQSRANFQAIETWAGTFQFVDTWKREYQTEAGGFVSGSEYTERTSGEIEFSYDAKTNSIHMFYNADRVDPNVDMAGETPAPSLTSETEGESIKTPMLSYGAYRWIHTPEHFLELGIRDAYGPLANFPPVEGIPNRGGRVAFRHPTEKFGGSLREIDVRRFFGYENIPFAEMCDMYAGAIRGDNGPETQQLVEKHVSLVERQSPDALEYVLEIEIPDSRPNYDEPLFTTRTVFNADLGFCATQHEVYQLQTIIASQVIQFGKRDDVYIPEEVRIRNYSTGIPGDDPRETPRIERTFILQSTKVNEPIDPEVFSIGALELGYGERLIDEIENRLYVLDKSGMVPAEEFVYVGQMTGTLENRGTKSRIWYLLVGNGILLAAIMTVYFIRSRSADHAAKKAV